MKWNKLYHYPPTTRSTTDGLRTYRSPADQIAGTAFVSQRDTLYRNHGDGTFTDISLEVGIVEEGLGLSVAVGDYDNDGDPDIQVANDMERDFLYQNSGDGTFVEVASLVGVGYDENGMPGSGMGSGFGDYDNDEDWPWTGDEDNFLIFVPADGYLDAVARVREYILAGDVFQTNLSQRFDAPLRDPPWAFYRRLRAKNAAPFAAFLDFPDATILSASPERFLGVDTEGHVETRPIKGTRPRGLGPDALPRRGLGLRDANHGRGPRPRGPLRRGAGGADLGPALQAWGLLDPRDRHRRDDRQGHQGS